MRVYFDDESERALLAARMGYGEGVGDADLAAAVEAWFERRPMPARTTRLRPDDLEEIQRYAVRDLSALDDEGEPDGYASQSTWLGAG
jgi:hypothetical protein